MGFWSAGRAKPARNMKTGMPTMAPTQMKRYSLTFSFRSARARSRARLAPKSRPSTALFSCEIAALCEMRSPSDAALSGFLVSSFPEA